MAAGGDEYGNDGFGRSLWADCGGNPAQDPYRAGGALRAECEYQLLHAAWRLVRISVCDNFSRRGAGAFCGSWWRTIKIWSLVAGRWSLARSRERRTTSDQRLAKKVT